MSAPAERMSPDSAPRNGAFVWLLVDYTQGGDPLEDANEAWTIGFNQLDDTGVDEWQFVGWSWTQDCFTEGSGKVIGWLPCDFPTTATKRAH